MTRTLLALPLAALSIVAWPATPARAQNTNMARGTVTAVAADSVSVKVRDAEMKFSVDSKTQVVAVGAGTKARQATAAGKAGPVLSEVVKVGQAVEVSYSETSGALHASRIRAILTVGSGGGSVTEAKQAAEVSSGAVTSVSATSLTISGSAGSGASFTQTFTIDAQTKVIGKGAGTAAAAKGGKPTITDLVASGDQVSVSFRDVGGSLHATDVRVLMKKGVR